MTPADPQPPRGARAHGRLRQGVRGLLVLGLLYTFLLAVDVLSTGLGGLGPDASEVLFRGIDNPLVGLAAGVLATVLAQSSSVTTSLVVSLVAADQITAQAAVPVVMGANIGTTITNTLASIGSLRRVDEFRRVLAGATMHDVFNALTVAVLLPLELLTGLLSRAALLASDLVGDVEAGEFESPLRQVVAGVTDMLETLAVAGLGDIGGPVALVVGGLTAIFATLYGITRNMRQLIAGTAERSLNRALSGAGWVAIAVGAAMTVAVQSSSIATSLLVPMIAAGVLSLEHAYPITLGANLGTTVTALLAAFAHDELEALQIALVHLLFNVFGVVLFYAIPWLRGVPLRLARRIGAFAAPRRYVVFVYVIGAFYVLPLVVILLVR